MHVAAIAHLVERIVAETERAVGETGNEVLRERTRDVLVGLRDCGGRLVEVGGVGRVGDVRREEEEGGEEGGVGGDEEDWKEVVGRLPPLAFEVARRTKELVVRVDGADGGDEGDEFR